MICDGGLCRIILPPTPQEILDEHGVDVFAESVGQLTYQPDPQVVVGLRDMCWRRFRHRPIGDYDHEVWLERLTDKVNELWYGYSRTISLLMSNDLASLTTSKEVVSDSSSVNKDLLTTNDLAESSTQNATSSTDTVRNESTAQSGESTVDTEDHPDIQAGTTQYLSARQKTVSSTDNTTDVTDSVDSTASTTASRTNTGTVSVSDDTTAARTATTTRNDGLLAKTALEMHEAVMECTYKFVKDLEPLFLNRW